MSDRLKPGNCHKCGLPLSDNPHPEAGKPSHYLNVGCPRECIPCLTHSRHQWAGRAMKAENEVRDLQAARATAEQRPDTPSFEAKHVSTKSRHGKIILTLSLDALEGAPRFLVTPINPCVVRALKSQQDAAIPFRPHHEILDALKTDPKLLADIEKAVEASKQSIAQLERERTVTRDQLNTPLCQAAGDYDVEALMDRWGIPSHLRDRFRDPMRKLVVCTKQDAAIESQRSGDGS